MQNVVADLHKTVDTVHQINSTGVTADVIIVIIVMSIVLSFVMSKFFTTIKLYKEFMTMVDERVEIKLRPIVDLVNTTNTTVTHLNKSIIELNATTSLLKEYILKEKGNARSKR